MNELLRFTRSDDWTLTSDDLRARRESGALTLYTAWVPGFLNTPLCMLTVYLL